jgi:hypothetical protein
VSINTNPLSYNAYIQQIGVMAVVTTAETAGVWAGVDAAFNTIVPQMLNYAELRIQRDLDLLPSQTENSTYTLTAGDSILRIPIDDFLIIETIEVTQVSGGKVVNSTPLIPVSQELIQNCYSGAASAGTPKYFAMVGDDFGNGADTFNKILLGPQPNFAYTLRVRGTIRTPSLFKYAAAGVADTSYTYISAYYPDMLIMASMIYISAFQRNFGPASDTPDSGMTYEKQYQALRLGAISEENRKKFEGSGWSSYSTPTSATPTR